jgi:hypothetical protein
MTVIVDAINAVLRTWFVPHIEVKSIEVGFITLTDSNTPIFIVHNIDTARSKTPSFNLLPCLAFGRVVRAVGGFFLSREINPVTPAGFGHDHRASALALAIPLPPSQAVGANLTRCFVRHRQASKYLSGQINKFTIRISHVVRSCLANELVRACGALQRVAGLSIVLQETRLLEDGSARALE